MNVHDYATRLARADERAGAGTTTPDPMLVVCDMLVAARAVGRYDAVRAACVAIHGESLVASVEEGIENG